MQTSQNSGNNQISLQGMFVSSQDKIKLCLAEIPFQCVLQVSPVWVSKTKAHYLILDPTNLVKRFITVNGSHSFHLGFHFMFSRCLRLQRMTPSQKLSWQLSWRQLWGWLTSASLVCLLPLTQKTQGSLHLVRKWNLGPLLDGLSLIIVYSHIMLSRHYSRWKELSL